MKWVLRILAVTAVSPILFDMPHVNAQIIYWSALITAHVILSYRRAFLY